jgi:Na+/H+ antiporter NhaA
VATVTDPAVTPLRRFLGWDAAAAALLLGATVLALLWANSPLGDTYDDFWHTELALRIGGDELALDLQHWVNDGLMVFFFFVIGLELRRELEMGGLTDAERARVPLVASVAGLAVPALVFLALNPTGEAARAWGVVISTDTAFLLGVLAVAGPRFSAPVRLFLLTMAVADDVGALTIIALFYTEDLRLLPLALALLGLFVIVKLRRLEVWRGPAYLVVAVGVWLATYESGVHPTIAGVVIALLMPVHAPRRDQVEEAERLTRRFRQSPTPESAHAAREGVVRAVSVNERLQRLYEPWTTYVIIPVFALANAGVHLTGSTLDAALSSRLTWGIIAGLVLGKLVGITVATVLTVRLRLATLPPGLPLNQVVGGAALSGIGFTISLFIVDLALDDPALQDQARVGVLTASVLAAVLGWAIFRGAAALGREPAGPPTRLALPVDPVRDHIRGSVDAPLTLVEYGDFECPFCSRATGSIEEVRDYFGDRLRYVFRHLPLEDVHPHASTAAEASEAAAAQGKFWEMHDHLFRNQDDLELRDLLRHAWTLGLDVSTFAEDLVGGRWAKRVHQDLIDAEASGAAGTPTFFVGEERHTGSYDAATLIRALEASGGR